jgi:hypothetical protein
MGDLRPIRHVDMRLGTFDASYAIVFEARSAATLAPKVGAKVGANSGTGWATPGDSEPGFPAGDRHVR